VDTDIKNNVISSIIQDERCVRVRVHVPVRVRVWVRVRVRVHLLTMYSGPYVHHLFPVWGAFATLMEHLLS
jgi:hypothetical protein